MGKMTILHHSCMGVGIYTFQTSVKPGQLLHRRLQTPSPRTSFITLENINFQTLAADNLSPIRLRDRKKMVN